MSRAALSGVLAVVALSAPAASAGPWTAAPTTTSARRAANDVVFGSAADVQGGFNTILACCNSTTSVWLGASEALRGAFITNDRGEWVRDLVTAASASARGLSYTISPKALWYWGGRKLPVTYRDFVYTLRRIDDPASDIIDRTGYANLDPTRFEHRGERQVTFFWRTGGCSTDTPCGPYANWKSLFATLYPAAALAGLDFNTIWTNCICGNNGRPVADGPFYLARYQAGRGTTLVRNPYWGGAKPGLARIVFEVIPDPNLLAEAMRSGTVDAIAPPFGPYLLPLRDTPGLAWEQVPGYILEHLEFRVGKGSSNPLLRAPWMRQAIGLAIDRQAIIDAVLGPASRQKPLDSLLFYATDPNYRPSFARWSYNPAKALTLLKAHCTGGPTTSNPSNKKVWQCSGLPATFSWTWSATSDFRTQIEALAHTDLQSVGIAITERPQTGIDWLTGGDFDIADFSWLSSGDPGDYNAQLRCSGNSNYTGYCSHAVDALLQAASGELRPARRAALLQRADAILASQVPWLPLYQRPAVLIHKSDLLGMRMNPDSEGPTWNVEDWHWKR